MRMMSLMNKHATSTPATNQNYVSERNYDYLVSLFCYNFFQITSTPNRELDPFSGISLLDSTNTTMDDSLIEEAVEADEQLHFDEHEFLVQPASDFVSRNFH